MQQRSLVLASAPAPIMYDEVPKESGRGGTILFYHSFGGSKDQLYSPVLTMYFGMAFLYAPGRVSKKRAVDSSGAVLSCDIRR